MTALLPLSQGLSGGDHLVKRSPAPAQLMPAQPSKCKKKNMSKMNLREIKTCVWERDREIEKEREGGRDCVCVWQALKMAMQKFWLEAAKVLLRALLLEVAARRQSNALRLFYTFLVFFLLFFFVFAADSSRVVRSGCSRGGAVGTIGLGALVNCKPSFSFQLR